MIMTLVLESVKEPDAFYELRQGLELSEEMIAKHFEFGEYATIELEVNERLEIVGGRFLARSR